MTFDDSSENRLTRMAFSPDEVAESLGISRELINDLLRTGQLGSVKAGRRRIIGRHHINAERDLPFFARSLSKLAEFLVAEVPYR